MKIVRPGGSLLFEEKLKEMIPRKQSAAIDGLESLKVQILAEAPPGEEESWKRVLAEMDFSHPAFSLPNDLRLGVPADAHLRRDSRQVVFYGSELFDVWIYRLLPDQVVALSLFNGHRSLQEVAEAVAFLGNCSPAVAHVKTRSFLKLLDYPTPKNLLLKIQGSGDPKVKIFDVREYLLRPEDAVQSVRLDKPVSLILMITERCQTNCRYCYACRHPVPSGDLLSVRRIKQLVEEAARLGVACINLEGGDLFARREHMEILECVLSNGIHTGISTKCYISREKAKELYRIGVRRIQVGLDSTEAMADYLVGSPGYFHRAVETIRNLAEAGIVPRTNSIIVRESLHLLPDLIGFLMTLPLGDIKVAPAFRSMFRGGEEIVLTPLQKQWYRSRMQEAQQKYPDHVINWECDDDLLDWSPEERQQRMEKRAHCSSGRTQIVIAPNGKAVTCEQSPQTEEFICGDCSYQSIEEIWNSEQLRNWYEPPREKFQGTACYDCGDFTRCVHCVGHCWLQGVKMFGRLYGPHPYCPKGPLPAERWQ